MRSLSNLLLLLIERFSPGPWQEHQGYVPILVQLICTYKGPEHMDKLHLRALTTKIPFIV